ncbi:hypothetical protein LNTAR_19292 [Lentisphaera araneosa HTCC2155]|uniref:Knr4/Smi1-like domain-containing protein n=1 Tax=Lentisphaera araneosa HTCC2155 TaxID=313628 RepID=A6DQS4_9BACT|nr:SMI1/KNR4 family protein [Lentisphaera araneosa]EDM25974.1 hypothetical protein LNTAR_19292 [Lentisphaera araneosa HTCC2155]
MKNNLSPQVTPELNNKIIDTINKISCEDEPGTIQVSENYDIKIEDENWKPNSPLVICPEWYSSILKSLPLSGLFFLAPEPEEKYMEEHEFLELTGWENVLEYYPFFIPDMVNSKHYPIASSGYGYLVINHDSTPNDPIYRWDGSAMEYQKAFNSFSDLLDSIDN